MTVNESIDQSSEIFRKEIPTSPRSAMRGNKALIYPFSPILHKPANPSIEHTLQAHHGFRFVEPPARPSRRPHIFIIPTRNTQ